MERINKKQSSVGNKLPTLQERNGMSKELPRVISTDDQLCWSEWRNLLKIRMSGFSFVELMIALSITAIILVGIVSIVSAAGTATEAARETSEKQAQLRYSMLKLKDLISQSRLVCKKTDDYILLWKADDNPANGRIDVLELAYLDRGTDADYLRILEFSSCPDWLRNELRYRDSQLATLGSWSKAYLINNCSEYYTELLPQCQNVEITLDTSVPDSRVVTVSFSLEENGIQTEYEVNTTLCNRAEHLLDDSDEIVAEDDDE